MAKVGDIKGISIDGVDYEVASDSDMQQTPSVSFETAVTSGKPVYKFKKQVPEIKGIKLICEKSDLVSLMELAKQQRTNIKFVITDANDATWTGIGSFAITETSSQTGQVSITIFTNEDLV